ncbi:imidazole glycerol phosphate synthase subunit HisH [Methylovirgula sp. 4M-Z18]|uniref:imidazole glycerol phosphate synthase subunit HisH n=1 Tax=Methylovirgula sp. 4M-Z18 TaxID=2293567 RepID=UPI000E2F4D85|nr:imidazole glycerol phosphate synthase subunit HisH [Methylovirgula sp. 4M-Z18]RFB78062.1 imidazole glycerol phosphate synthase subunit HisH [Methylovirgula sp. 4M-Z18]
MSVAIIDYGLGNLHSVQKAFERVAQEAALPGPILVTADPDKVREADRIVLPGVGAFADCAAGLNAIAGMRDALEEAVRHKGRPFLGICVGMQLMASRGLEHVITPGLDWIAGDVKAITPSDANLKIPHMGWNTLRILREHPLLADIATGERGLHAYFVHSFHLDAKHLSDVVAEAEYGGPVTAIVAKDNMFGTQFHPEKSQTLGLRLIGNFLTWKP